jgi:hypothetical protein
MADKDQARKAQDRLNRPKGESIEAFLIMAVGLGLFAGFLGWLLA